MPKKKAAKKAKRRGSLTAEDVKAVLLDGANDRRAVISDGAAAKQLGVSRQYVSRLRAELKIDPCPPEPEPLPVAPPQRDDIRVVVGWRVHVHRLRRGWTRTELAGTMGGSWTSSGIAGVEQGLVGPGRRGVTIETLQELAGVLEVSPSDLLLRPKQTALAPALDFQGGPASDVEAAWVQLTALERPPLREAIGINIARRRLALGWSQTELASRLPGLADTWTHSRVSHVEAGHRGHGRPGVTLDTLPAFAAALKVTEADLARLPRQPALVPVETG